MQIKTILCVDDNETDQFLNEVIIKQYDETIEIIKAYDGSEALELMKGMDKLPDLILLDINMPGMDGFEFLDAFSSQTEITSVVVMLTSSDQRDDKERAMGYGCVRTYIEKPLEIEDMEMLAGL